MEDNIEWKPVVSIVKYFAHNEVFKVGDTIDTPSGEKGTVTEHTEEYIEYQVGNNTPERILLTEDLRFFTIKEQ